MNSLYIKNMVCSRCIRVVREELTGLGLDVVDVQLGKVVLAKHPKNIEPVETILNQNGFELLEDKNAQIVESIKNQIIELIYSENLGEMKTNLSHYLSKQLGRDYSALSKLFSEVESITLEKYFILHKVERIKEFMVYDELTLSEIAYKLGYSSVQHLSNQFKKTTGLSPSYFKNVNPSRRPIDGLKSGETL
ncbi:MAG: helix-turn-helix transcriptional regulator [Candidatus Marinimicrobia bacterium]|jgi:AraC-like DNA-binding protein|nr:helix-turn-helix transcriptional regulator [Candidatus Neomarinimicrobiota bacterium]MBT7270394.1 helix-turn-helix transcriptional regulator [Candidatus Neomarinimicrobiota bacterium]|tara:strand:- start:2816 stop:3391 length:576 start_codon:yes stop_codon:yes gene_type:complete